MSDVPPSGPDLGGEDTKGRERPLREREPSRERKRAPGRESFPKERVHHEREMPLREIERDPRETENPPREAPKRETPSARKGCRKILRHPGVLFIILDACLLHQVEGLPLVLALTSRQIFVNPF